MTILNVSTPLQSRSQEELLDPSIVELLFSEVLTGQYFNISLVTILVYHSSTSLLYSLTETEDLTTFLRIIVITLDKEVNVNSEDTPSLCLHHAILLDKVLLGELHYSYLRPHGLTTVEVEPVQFCQCHILRSEWSPMPEE